MKVFVLLVVAVLLLAGCKKDEEKYIAKVNGNGIDREKFDKIVGKRIKQIERFGRKFTPIQKFSFEKRLLDNLINEEILLQEAKKHSVTIKEGAAKEKLVSIKARYPKKEEFEKILKQQELTENDLIDMFKKQLTIEALIKKEVTDKITIPDNEIKQYYDKNIALYKVPEQVQARHILLKTKEKKGSKKAKTEAKKLKKDLNKIRKQIISKKLSFEDAAKKSSDCPSKTRGGDLGLFSRGRMAKEFEKVAFSSKLGKVSKPFSTPFGYHILEVTKKEKARTKKFAEVKEDIKKRLTRQQGNKKVREYIENLKGSAKIDSYLGDAPKPEVAKAMPPKTEMAKKEVPKVDASKKAEPKKDKK